MSEYLTPYAGSERAIPKLGKSWEKQPLVLLRAIKEYQKDGLTIREISRALHVPFERVCEVILWDLRQ